MKMAKPKKKFTNTIKKENEVMLNNLNKSSRNFFNGINIKKRVCLTKLNSIGGGEIIQT